MEQTPSTQATPVATSAAPIQAVVEYLPNVTVVGAKPALLEWGIDDHIRLFEMDFDTKQAKSVIFDSPVNQITKVSGSMIMLTFHIGDKKYNTQFSQTAAGKMGMSALGLMFAYKETTKSGIGLWTEKLKQNSVPVTVMGWAWAFKWGFIAAGVILVIAIIIAVSMNS
jgi:hypothetical protein